MANKHIPCVLQRRSIAFVMVAACEWWWHESINRVKQFAYRNRLCRPITLYITRACCTSPAQRLGYSRYIGLSTTSSIRVVWRVQVVGATGTAGGGSTYSNQFDVRHDTHSIARALEYRDLYHRLNPSQMAR